ncbi:MAG: LON peptidase substrate-binding domain-containing protein, partial [Desulfobulbia bacterium]
MAELDPQQEVAYPMMPLRDIVIFPYMVAPLVVGRERSIKALEEAMAKRSEIFLVTQKDAAEDDPTEESVHAVGTIATVMQLLRLPDGTIKALVEGKRRGRIMKHLPNADYFVVQLDEQAAEDEGGLEATAYVREIQASFKEYVKYNKKVPAEVIKSLARIENPAKFVDVLAAHLPLNVQEKQGILENFSVVERLAQVLSLIHKEIEIAELEEVIRARVKKKMDKTQKDY